MIINKTSYELVIRNNIKITMIDSKAFVLNKSNNSMELSYSVILSYLSD